MSPRRAAHLLGRSAPALLLTVLLTGAAEAPRARHTELLATYPAADSVHRSEISEIRLRYSTAVQLPLSTIRIEGPRGPLPNVSPVDSVAGSAGMEILVRLAAPLPTGSYTVSWTTAGPDSHPLTGTFAFAVGRAAAEPAPAAEGDPPASATAPPGDPVLTGTTSARGDDAAAGARTPAGVAVRALFLLSVIGMLGTAVFRLAVLAPLGRDALLGDAVAGAGGRVRALAWAAAGAAVVALPARLGKQSTDLFGAEAAFAPGSVGRILASAWGGAWVLESAMAALFVAGLLLVGGRADRSRGWWAMLVAALGMAMVPALSGHAAGTVEGLRAFAVLNDTVHVAAAGTWIGTLGVLVLAGMGAVGGGAAPTEGPLPPLARVVNLFSRTALVAAALLVATGVVSAALQLGGVAPLFTSTYGRTLLVKLGLVAAAGSLGLYNWRVVRPRLADEPNASLLRIPASVEATLGVVIVIVTAVLIATPLPTH